MRKIILAAVAGVVLTVGLFAVSAFTAKSAAAHEACEIGTIGDVREQLQTPIQQGAVTLREYAEKPFVSAFMTEITSVSGPAPFDEDAVTRIVVVDFTNASSANIGYFIGECLVGSMTRVSKALVLQIEAVATDKAKSRT